MDESYRFIADRRDEQNRPYQHMETGPELLSLNAISRIGFYIERINNGFLLGQNDLNNKVFCPNVENLNNILIECVKTVFKDSVIQEGESV